MKNAFLVAGITLSDCLRNKALYGIFLIAIVLFAFNIIFTGMFSWELGKVAVDMGLSAVSISGLIIIFFFSIQAMSNDLEKKTIYFILARPITKGQYLVGKYIGLGAVIVFSSLVLGMLAVMSVLISTAGAEGYIPPYFNWELFVLSLLFQTLSLLVTLSFSLFWVFANTHSFVATLLSLMTYFIGQNIENVKNMILAMKLMPPDSLPMTVINLVSWILPNLAIFDIKQNASYGLSVSPSTLVISLIYGISYIIICIILSALVFDRRNLE